MSDSPETDTSRLLRQLPSVDALLQQRAIASLLGEYPRGEIVACSGAHWPAGSTLPGFGLAPSASAYSRLRLRMNSVPSWATAVV